MIDIYNIHHGWLTIRIKNREFIVSHLTNVVKDIDETINYYLLSIDLSYPCHHNSELVYLDGEGKDVFITWITNGEKLILIWEQYDFENLLEVMEFNFNGFVAEWKSLKEKIKDDYNKNFVMDLYPPIK